MGNMLPKITALLPVVLLAAGINPLSAASPADEFHADAGMRNHDRGSIARTYGYLRVLRDTHGNALIETMFSNGNPSIDALFNARIRFLDVSGETVHQVELDCPLGAGDAQQATECKVSKILRQVDFDSVDVDFYLSDIPDANALAMH